MEIEMLTAGMKSSEFLLALLNIIGGMLLIYLAATKVVDPAARDSLIDAGKWMAVGGGSGYVVSRGLAKFGIGSSTPAPVPTPTDDKTAATNIAAIK